MKLFVDTSAWLALNDRSDQFHALAVEKLASIRAGRISLVTSDYVLDESVTIIRLRASHAAAVIFGQSILGSSVIDLIPVGSDDRLAAWEIFKKYADQDFSFTDCTSFALMRKLCLKTAFSFDGHFSLIGFNRF
jgi:hypothetical protein